MKAKQIMNYRQRIKSLSQNLPGGDQRPENIASPDGFGTCTKCHLSLPTVVLFGGFAMLASLIPFGAESTAAASELKQKMLFESGTGGHHTYRIPAIVVAKDGTLVAFCEGRKNSRSDTGDIDLLVSRSEDNGKHWTTPEIVWNDAGNTCGNPCPVVDQETGSIWLLTTWNSGDSHEKRIHAGFGDDSRKVFVLHSEDNGKTWSEPNDITTDVKKTGWSWYATGPGAGIQIKHGKYRNRLVIPCDHKVFMGEGKKEKYYSHAIYSDDQGKTWQLGNATPTDAVNECEVVELIGGKLLLNMRNYDKKSHTRQIATSNDGGETWEDQKFDPALIEPICQASIRRHSWPTDGKPGVILFSNPASNKRKNMTVRASFDDAKTWPVKKVLYTDSSAYSCLVVLPNGDVGCLYEVDNYRGITFAKFPLEWLTE